MTPFERQIIQKRAAMIKRSKPIFANAIKKQYSAAIKLIKEVPPDQIKHHLKGAIGQAPMITAFKMTYPLAADIGMMWRKRLLSQKDGVEDIHKQVLQSTMSHLSQTKSKSRIAKITTTSYDHIEGAVNRAITKGFEDGLGVSKTRDLILEYVNDNYDEITPARAQLISQTEMISASNMATIEGTRSTGYAFKKFWSTSGLDNVRDSHLECEQFTIDNGGLDEDEVFPNGLLFPGDPNGSAEEVCNCHCTLMTEISRD